LLCRLLAIVLQGQGEDAKYAWSEQGLPMAVLTAALLLAADPAVSLRCGCCLRCGCGVSFNTFCCPVWRSAAEIDVLFAAKGCRMNEHCILCKCKAMQA
jgi:hypothetical protein